MSDVMIEAHGLAKNYGPFTALKNVTFKVNRGEVLGFLGPNGAGKTTTMKILTCFIAPSEGTARVNGADVFEDPLEVRRAIGYLPENTPLYTEMLVLEYLRFIAKMRGLDGAQAIARLKKVVEETSLGDVLGKNIGELSKGYRQRVGLAQALVHEPPILILDEPMSGLDPNQANEIRELIREIGRERTVVLSTHNLAEVQVTCSRVLIIANGAIVADDTTDELSARAGKASYIATLQTQGKSASDIAAAFGSLTGSAKILQCADANETRIALTPDGNQDLRADIFNAAVQANFVLVGLEKKGENLEDVFRQLTLGDSKTEATR